MTPTHLDTPSGTIICVDYDEYDARAFGETGTGSFYFTIRGELTDWSGDIHPRHAPVMVDAAREVADQS